MPPRELLASVSYSASHSRAGFYEETLEKVAVVLLFRVKITL